MFSSCLLIAGETQREPRLSDLSAARRGHDFFVEFYELFAELLLGVTVAHEVPSHAHLGERHEIAAQVPRPADNREHFCQIFFGHARDDFHLRQGYLHDVIEDTKYTKEDLLKAFNEDILSLVLGDTEKDKSLS